MKTSTKNQIVEIIKKNGPTRPFDLVRLLKVSPQAVHRHLRSLVSAGIIEPRGTPPTTHYMIQGIPDFKPALGWFRASTAEKVPSVCETRDQFSARLNHFIPLQKQGLSNDAHGLGATMKIEIKKFGEILSSRPSGREAALGTKAYIRLQPVEKIELDFTGVLSIGPSWLDEFLSLLEQEYGRERVACLPSDNPSVNRSLDIIR